MRRADCAGAHWHAIKIPANITNFFDRIPPPEDIAAGPIDGEVRKPDKSRAHACREVSDRLARSAKIDVLSRRHCKPKARNLNPEIFAAGFRDCIA
jgi:hypothetical protein